jgi:hypothetical protein
MKKIAKIAALAIFGAMAMTSCKKDYTCTCKDDEDGTVFAATKYSKVSKKDAKSSCETADTQAAILGISCSLD